jgi:hypothetical protein
VIPDFAALFAFCDLHASRLRGLAWVRAMLASDELLYFDRQGFPIPGDGTNSPSLVWARLRAANPAYVTVAKDEVPDGSRLSTVWLGLDHGFGVPLFFETMRFAAAGEELEFPDPETGEPTTQLRYGSEEEAAAAHHEILRRLRVRLGH